MEFPFNCLFRVSVAEEGNDVKLLNATQLK